MPYSLHRMIEQHSWTGPTHNSADAFPHLFIVAMDRTFATCRFVVSKAAEGETVVCIIEHFGTITAKFSVSLLMPAVHPHHHLNDFFLFCNPAGTHLTETNNATH